MCDSVPKGIDMNEWTIWDDTKRFEGKLRGAIDMGRGGKGECAERRFIALFSIEAVE